MIWYSYLCSLFSTEQENGSHCDISLHVFHIFGSYSVSITFSCSLPPLTDCLPSPYCPCFRYTHTHMHTNTCMCTYMHTQKFLIEEKAYIYLFKSGLFHLAVISNSILSLSVCLSLIRNDIIYSLYD